MASARSVWMWRSLDSTELRDPAELPESAAAHKARIGVGPRWARLCPVTVAEVRGPLTSVKSEKGESLEIPTSLLLPWYEGLLVLDAMEQANCTEEWFQELSPCLEQERRKSKNGHLSSCQYVEKRLVQLAITGPRFVTDKGTTFSHRRPNVPGEEPPEGETRDGWFAVERLVQYLPPWEAFLHPRCGFYQDHYLVQWAPPFDEVDYSSTETGDEMRGVTWEPDECLPENLDCLRMKTKKEWTERQRDLERDRRSDRPAKVRRFNPLNVSLWEDLASPAVSHGWSELPEQIETEIQIKKGWPKKLSEYPAGYGPAEPPGFCGNECDCMEDWHLGKRCVDTGKRWIETPDRNSSTAQALTALASQKFVMRRGQVSGNHYLEATTAEHQRVDVQEVTYAAEVSRFVFAALRQVAASIPLHALQREDGKGIIRNFVTAFFQEGEPSYLPLQYKLTEGPKWLVMDATGETNFVGVPDPAGGTVRLTVLVVHMNGESDTVHCVIDPSRPHTGGSTVAALTSQTAKKVAAIRPQSLRLIVTEHLASIYNVSQDRSLEVTVARWARTMWEIAAITRTACSTHVVK